LIKFSEDINGSIYSLKRFPEGYIKKYMSLLFAFGCIIIVALVFSKSKSVDENEIFKINMNKISIDKILCIAV
jgi:hypothetical protein